MNPNRTPRLFAAAALLATALSSQARAQDTKGFTLNKYEPTPAGTWFFSVDHPWYSRTRYFAGGFTLNYAHNPLVLGFADDKGNFRRDTSIVENALLGHIDLAGSFLDRVQISASLPVTFLENGSTSPLPGIAAATSASVGDPRIGLQVRLWGQHDYERIGISLGAYVWVPIGTNGSNAGDSGVRFMPRLSIGGLAADRLRYALNVGFQYRPEASLGPPQPGGGNSVGSTFQMGLGLAYADKDIGIHIGPELTFATQVVGGRGFTRYGTSMEALLGISYLIKKQVMVGIAPGFGVLLDPGTPDFRLLARIAYAPYRPDDRDKDGIEDKKDLCPDEHKGPNPDPNKIGCPLRDRDGDGVMDVDDLCPDVHKGDHPDPQKLGCPLTDRDKDEVFDVDDLCPDTHKGPSPDPSRRGCPHGDRDGDTVFDDEDLCPDVHKGDHPDPKRLGCPLTDRDGDKVFDFEDLCPDTPMGDHPDPNRLGCPLGDRDGDGVYDNEDLCPDVHKGPHPDPKRLGCPAIDTDGDKVFDFEDVCPQVPAGQYPDPDPARLGCPLGDRDFDSIPDPMDACPDKAGPPHPDPKKNGCPSLVELKAGEIKILTPIFFATDKDIILPKSYPVLQAVADVLVAKPEIKKVSVEGHTDIRGSRAHNIDLSDRRAKSVVRWLTQNGIAADRLSGIGYGPDRPVANNNTDGGRSLNRRVEFRITDPAPAPPKPGEDVIKSQAPEMVPEGMTAPDDAGDGVRKSKRGKGGRKAGGKRKKR